MIGSNAQTGILLVGHGTRQPGGNQPFLDLCREVASRAGGIPVEPCFLEIAEPAIDHGLENLARRGTSRVVVVPMQLTAGRHVRHDIPDQVRRALKRLPGVSVTFADHLGSHPGLAALAEDRLRQALCGRGQVRRGALVLAARGSRDRLVKHEILRLAQVRRDFDGGGKVSACFLAMAEPSFDETLQHVASTSPDRIIVQPHLLLPGRLSERVESTVHDMAAEHPQIEWVAVAPLGPDPRLARFALELASQTQARRGP